MGQKRCMKFTVHSQTKARPVAKRSINQILDFDPQWHSADVHQMLEALREARSVLRRTSDLDELLDALLKKWESNE